MSVDTHQLHPVHQMIQALGRDEQLRDTLSKDRSTVYAQFALAQNEIAALEEGSISAMAGIGVHPMYRMHWMMLSKPDAAAQLSVAEYVVKAGAG